FDLHPGTTINFKAEFYNTIGQLVGVESFSGTTRAEPGAVPAPLHTIYVSPTGDDLNPGSEALPKRTLASAFAAVEDPGTHVILRDGIYYAGDLSCPGDGQAGAPTVIKAAPGETPIIDGSAAAMLQLGWTDLGGGYFSRPFSGTTWLVAQRNRTTGQILRAYPIETLAELNGKYSSTPGNTFASRNITAAYHCSGSTLTLYTQEFTPGGDWDMHVAIEDRGVEHDGDHHVVYDGLTFRFFAGMAIYVNRSDDVIVRNCAFRVCNLPIGVKRASNRLLVEDNDFLDDTLRWGWLPKQPEGFTYSAHIETGAVLTHWPYDGRGLVIRNNTIRGLMDGVHLVPSNESPTVRTSETDFYGNTIYDCSDDLMELDGFARNVRVFQNRMHRYLAGISIAQAIHGPVYVLYNDIGGAGHSTSVDFDGFEGFPVKANGGLVGTQTTGHVFFFHNTVWTDKPDTACFRVQYANWEQLVFANNIWQATRTGWRVWQSYLDPISLTRDIIFHDTDDFLDTNSGDYLTQAQVAASAPGDFQFLTNALVADPELVSPDIENFNLALSSPAIDAGIIIPGINDESFLGAAPDIGAHESGAPSAMRFQSAQSIAVESAGALNLTLVLSASSVLDASAVFSVTGGSASNGTDYTLADGVVSIPAGLTTGLIAVTILVDGLAESNETVTIQLSDPTNATISAPSIHTLTILDDDAAGPAVSFLVPNSSVLESSATAQVAVALSHPFGATVTADYSVVGGTASNGSDYVLANGSVHFMAGQTIAQFSLGILADTIVELPESIQLLMTPATNCVPGAPSTHQLTITDDDQVNIQLAAAASSGPESTSPAGFLVTLSEPAPFAIRVAFQTSQGSASNLTDYVGTNITLVFDTGITTQSAHVVIVDDGIAEGVESFSVTLSSPSNAVLGGLTTATYTIQDDDFDIAYVNARAVGSGSGSSWANAYTNLQTALADAAPFTEIWVAAGVYTPGNSVSNSFTLADNRAVFGGFSVSETNRDGRDWLRFPTILSGDCLGNDTANWGNRADNVVHVIRCQSSYVTVDGFIIRGGNADNGTVWVAGGQGGGFRADGAKTVSLSNCLFTDNSAATGGGVYLRRCSDVELTDCHFSGNRATENGDDRGSGAVGGEALQTGHGAEFNRCIFAGNIAPNGRGGALYATTTDWQVNFRNCVFAGNTAGRLGGALFLREYPSAVINCTFSGNWPSAVQVREATPVLRNSILWNNGTEISIYSGGVAVDHCDINAEGYVGNNANVRADPQWVPHPGGNWTADADFDPVTGRTTCYNDQANWLPGAWNGFVLNPDTAQNRQFIVHSNTATTIQIWGDATALSLRDAAYGLYNYHLNNPSPCLDSGTLSGAPSTDAAGVARPQGPGMDMGAYEFSSFRANFHVTPNVASPPSLAVFTASVIGAQTNGLTYWWDFDGDGHDELMGVGLGIVSNLYTQVGSFTIRLTVSNAVGDVSQVIKPGAVLIASAIRFVATNGTHTAPYDTWSSAATNLPAVLDNQVDDLVVFVGPGTYKLSGQQVLTN
ncbi:MAG: right-handed parallel beta-helix repeat-containing protein, partial [Verrucomicrobia bacterium]|nr:right-handed parallel beta-helix repeat-containing protein [Verrucomicrobiota bacterium]